MRDTSDFEIPSTPERLHQVVDLPRRDAVHVRFLHDRQQRVLGAPAGLQQRREVRPGPHLRDRQLDRAHPRVPRPRPDPLRYAVRSPVRSCRSAPINPATSVSINACESTRMPSRSTSPSCSSRSLPTNADRSILGLAIASTPPCVLLLPERTHGTMRDGRSAVYAARSTEFPPRPGTLTRGADSRSKTAASRSRSSTRGLSDGCWSSLPESVEERFPTSRFEHRTVSLTPRFGCRMTRGRWQRATRRCQRLRGRSRRRISTSPHARLEPCGVGSPHDVEPLNRAGRVAVRAGRPAGARAGRSRA